MKKHPRLSAIFAALSAASLILVSSASFAGHDVANYKGEAPPCPNKVLLGGGYVGIGVSYDRYKFRNTFSATEDDGDTFYFTNPLAASGWDGNLNIGYGWYWCQYYLGVELAGVITDASSTTRVTAIDEFGSDSISFRTRARGSWHISVLPGVKLTDSTLLYIRLGYIDTQFRGRVRFTDDDGDVFTRSRTRWKNGFIGGVGLETYLIDNVSLRGEYQYTWYSNFSNNLTVDDTTFSARTKPSNSSFTLGLAYHFC
jgi:opacity protein-like surface antigen